MFDRRQSRDRRRTSARERRRKGDQRVFVIELSSSDLGIVELQKSADEERVDEVTSTSCIWRQSAASLNSADGCAELTAAFREVAREHSMHGAEIRVVLTGEFCVLRMFRGTVETVRAELQQLEQRSRLYLSLGPGEKVLVSNTQSLDARHAHAVAAVCNRATLETIQSAAEAAGIEIAVIEPALSALSRAVTRLPETPAGAYLLVHLNPSCMEVGVCHDGQLLLDYRPSGRTAVADLPGLLETHLNRLSRHVGRYLRVATPAIDRIYLCGEDELVRAATQQFQRQSKLRVLQVRPTDVKATWHLSDKAAGDVSAAALGALLATYRPAGDVDAPNLMKHIIDRKRQPLRPTLIRSAIPLAATLLVMATLAAINRREERSLELMRAERESLTVKEARATELRLQLMAAKVKVTQLEKLAAKLPGELGDTLVSRLAGCMPSDVWLSKVEIVDGATIRLHGASYQEAGVYDFVRWLEQSPGLTEVALKGTSPSSSATGPTTSFELELTLVELGDARVAVASPSLEGRGQGRDSRPIELASR
jgi:Tfp pilus assembly protein PilN